MPIPLAPVACLGAFCSKWVFSFIDAIEFWNCLASMTSFPVGHFGPYLGNSWANFDATLYVCWVIGFIAAFTFWKCLAAVASFPVGHLCSYLTNYRADLNEIWYVV